MVVGLIAVVFAAVDLCMLGWVVILGGGFPPVWLTMVGPAGLLNGLVVTGLAVLLLAAGVGILRRRAWGVKVCYLWIAYRLFVAFIGTWCLGFYAVTLFGVLALLGALPLLVWNAGLAVFLLIWLSRRKIKAEIATWQR